MKVKTFLISLYFVTLSLTDKMESHVLPYRVMPTGECLKYLEAHGLTIHDDWKYMIRSRAGLVYVLPNGETILMPTNFDVNYPGIVFKDKATFMHFAELDSFPIGDENMTWFERHRSEIRQFREHPDFYSKTLTQTLRVAYPFRNVDDMRTAFIKLQSVLNTPEQKKRPWPETEELIYSFGLGVINYLIVRKNTEVHIEDRYENYNPTAYPIAIIDGERTDVMSKVIRYISETGDHRFEIFARKLGLIT
jgi:hypothetical protein